MVTVHVDATIALPIIVSALAQNATRTVKPDMKALFGRKPVSDSPSYDFIVDPESQMLDEADAEVSQF